MQQQAPVLLLLYLRVVHFRSARQSPAMSGLSNGGILYPGPRTGGKSGKPEGQVPPGVV